MKLSNWLLFLCLFCLIANYGNTQDVNIRIATIVPEGSSWVKCLKDIDQDCRQQIKVVKLTIYAGGVAGENQSMLEKMKHGHLEGAGLGSAALGDFSSRLRIMEIPYMYHSLDEWKYVFKKIREDIESDLDKSGYIAIGWAYAGFAYIYSCDKIMNVQDFRQSKPWIYPGDPLMEDAFRELQASGVPLGTSGVLPAIQRGMVRCVYNSPYGLLAVQWHTSMRYCTDSPIANPIGVVIIKKSTFQRIPTQYQGKFLEICRKHFRGLSQEIDKNNEIAVKELSETYQIQKVVPDAKWLNELEKFGEQIGKRQIGKLYSQDFYNRVIQYQQEFRNRKQ